MNLQICSKSPISQLVIFFFLKKLLENLVDSEKSSIFAM